MQDELYNRFISPPQEYGAIPKWIWNINTEDISEDEIRCQFRNFKEHDGYTGVMIVLWNNNHYLDDLFFEKYGFALKAAKDVGLDIILWDENGFPSGRAGGLIENLYPQHMAKRLDMVSETIISDADTDYCVRLPEDKLMGIVRMNTETFEIADITESICVSDNFLKCRLPAGSWQIMIFTLAADEPGNLGLCKGRLIDYLSEEAVKVFINITHQSYYDRFPGFFGSVIKYAFYDEPSFWHISGGRIWTGDFNEKFAEKYGYNPVKLYPALFTDIGENTASARNALLSFRSELYSESYIKTMREWCNSHDLKLTGHMDQEEILSPVSISGDLMKIFENQDIPGIDQIFKYGRASSAYKIISSAADNYDKPAVMCEVFGAMGEDMPVENLFKEAMDQFAKGINFVVPQGTWYDGENNVIFPPELSFRSKKFGPALADYNDYIKRASSILRGGRHVSDIAILYSIADLYAYHRFGEGDPYLGGNIAPHVNYTEIGEALSLDIRKDFTYIHPDILNQKGFENYKVFILPAMEVIHAGNLENLRQFVAKGGVLISIGLLPSKSAEHGQDDKVRTIISELFDKFDNNKKCYHLPTFTPERLASVLNDTGIIFDVDCQPVKVENGNFTYIHKILEGRDIYFFANSGDIPVSAKVRLRGCKSLESWNPHTGERTEISEQTICENGATTVLAELDPVKSIFYISKIKNQK